MSSAKRLTRAITLWNESRLDLFEISQPDKNNEFHGVIRFYHQDSSNDGKYATKCVRVGNTASTVDVIETLSEKFRSDMRMLSKPKYALYEVHENGESRKLKDNEHPLTVQLNWIKEDREGRFLLRNEDDKRPVHVGNGLYEESEDTVKGFSLTRNLTKKDKKQKKKKTNPKGKEETLPDSVGPMSQEQSAAKQLYSEVPESTFTRTVSNPEAVMKKRREQKLQKRGAEVLKIYGDSINKEIPYKAMLLLPNDDTDTVIRDSLDKYGRGRDKTSDYMIVKVVLPPGSKPEECLEGGWGKETILGPDDCPLDIAQKWQPHQGTLVFQLRPCTPGYRSKRKQKTSSSSSQSKPDERSRKTSEQENASRKKQPKEPSTDRSERKADYENVPRQSKRPKLLEFLGPEKVVTHTVAPNVTEIGSDRRKASYRPFIELQQHPGLLASHCVITNMDGVVTVTPQDNNGEVLVDGKAIEETTMLSHGNVVWLGRSKHLVFCAPDRNISIPDIQRKIRSTAPRERQVRRNVKAPSNLSRQHDGSTSNVSGNRARNHSTASTTTSSSRSSSALHGRGPPPDQQGPAKVLEVNRNHEPKMRRPQSQLPLTQPPAERALHHRSVPPQTATVQPMQQSAPQQLPASLKVNPDLEESLIAEILSASASSLHFKLSPAYTIYLVQRHLVETAPGKIVADLQLVTDLLEQTIQMNSSSVSDLSFWMANASELLNFVRQDQDLTAFTHDVQDDFAKTVQLAFRHLVQCMQRTLFGLMPAFLSESDEDLPGGGDIVDLKKHNRNTEGPTMYDILHMLSSAMSLLRRCRVNAALTIQLFSQLFHSVNMWLFNRLVASVDSPRLCCREWGIRIRTRLAMVETWAEKQGLELAADCHLARITQATHLLQAPKYTGDDIAEISGTSFKLNSLQLRVLLSNYQPDEHSGERRISKELVDEVVAAAENSADELTRSDGRDVQLEEDPDLQLPFLLPEDGYSCDVVRGVPSGLTEFLQPLQQEGFCTYDIAPNASGNWTVHFQSILQQYQNALRSSRGGSESSNQPPGKPEVISISFNKRGGGMGLSIVAAKGIGQDHQGIYIRSVVKGGAADLDGRFESGDQLLSVDGQSLVGVDQARAASLMTSTGPTLMLKIAKQGAVYHGLAKLLSEPSPKAQHAPRRANPQHSHPRPRSEGYALNPNHPQHQASGQSARSQLFGGQARSFASLTDNTSALNHSTPHLNETTASSLVQPTVNNPPRSAISMGNLQQQPPPDPDDQSPRTWSRQYPFHRDQQQSVDINNMRRKATSQSALSPPLANEQQGYENIKLKDRTSNADRRDFSMKNSSSPAVTSPRESLPSPPSIVSSRSTTEKFSHHHSLDNPNYEHFPSPPPDFTEEPAEEDSSKRHFSPVKMEATPPEVVEPSRNISPRSEESNRYHRRTSPPHSKITPTSSPSSNFGSKTLDRPLSGKKTEVARVAPTQKKKQSSQSSSKSSTLPRHFKSASPWDRDAQEKKEQSIQEQLNVLRDEEINELTSRSDLTPLEQERLNNLIQEREFQARVQEDKMRMFSDDDISEEDYSVPDRPDRDRLIRLEGAHALRDAATRVGTVEKEDEDQLRWKEEQERKKKEAEVREKQEAERREERRRERERAERERQEEKRRRELQQQQEKERYEQEQRRLQEKEATWRENYNSLQREEEEQRRKLDEIRRLREEEENQLRELQAKRQAEEQFLQLESAKKRDDDALMKKREADAREEAERRFLEEKLSAGKSNSLSPSYKKYAPVSPYSPRSTTSTSYLNKGAPKRSVSPISTASNMSRSSPYNGSATRPVMRENAKPSSARPVSDGYALGKTDWSPDDLPPPPDVAATTPPASYGSRRPVSFVSSTNTPSVIGAQECYNDPRSKREATLKRDQSIKRRGPDPSRLTFKDRQRMFQGGKNSPVSKPKTSRKLMELEETLRGQM